MGALTDPITFRTSADETTDAYYRSVLNRLMPALLHETGGEGTATLILSGSLALGEGRSFFLGEGRTEPGSDIDLYVVVEDDRVEKLQTDRASIIERVRQAADADDIVIDIGFTSKPVLDQLEPTIMNCNLLHHGRVLHGDPSVLAGRENCPFEAIPAWDGFVLLLNRAAEEISELRLRPEGEQEARASWYRTGKTIRDLGTSALVVAGRYHPILAERKERVRLLVEQEGLESRAVGFLDDFSFWSDSKSASEPGSLPGNGPEHFRQAMQKKSLYVGAFWEWESALFFTDCREPRGETLRRRVRRWLEYVAENREGSWRSAARQALRGFPATPIIANSMAAVLLLLCWTPLTGDEPTAEDRKRLAEAHALTPASRGVGGSDYATSWIALRNDVCAFWNREVMGGTRPALALEQL